MPTLPVNIWHAKWRTAGISWPSLGQDVWYSVCVVCGKTSKLTLLHVHGQTMYLLPAVCKGPQATCYLDLKLGYTYQISIAAMDRSGLVRYGYRCIKAGRLTDLID